jgi:hypothetical protein
MPTRFNTNYPRFEAEDEFEELLCDLCTEKWGDSGTMRYGRRGQKQWGVDIFGQPLWLDGSYYGVQCKLRPSQTQLSKSEIEAEVMAARNFPHQLDRLIIATDTPRDNRIQTIVRKISEREIKRGGFAVEIWFWHEIQKLIATYPRVLVKYYHDHLTSLTNTDVLDRLIDRPLRILSLKLLLTTNTTAIEQRLLFRGSQSISAVLSPSDAKSVDYRDLLPDGLLCQVNTANESESDASLRRFLAIILAQEKLVEAACPVFILIPPALHTHLKSEVNDLHEQSNRFRWLSSELPPDEVADQIFATVFDYGYRRRGTIPTIDVSTRTRPNRPTRALLDLDWRSHLDTERHPTESEWNELFAPALRAVATQLTGLKEATRIQVDSELPLPASVALGFHLNLRVATMGVWARQVGRSDIKHLWLSNSERADITFVEGWHKDSGNARTAVVELSVGFSIHAAVQGFIERGKWVPDIWLELHLPTGEDGLNESEGVAYAHYVGKVIRQLTQRGITDTHLFLRVPAALGILIGQKLHACGRLHLYWFDNKNSSYKPAFVLA